VGWWSAGCAAIGVLYSVTDGPCTRDAGAVDESADARATRGLLLLADISGYTAFLQAVSDAHGEQIAAMPEVPAAYPLMTSLLNGIVDELRPPFVLSQIEGDAFFGYASDEGFGSLEDSVLECLRDCYSSFRQHLDKTENLMLCSCQACSRLQTLDLKFVLHRGDYAIRSIAGHEQLLGPDVTMAHLLLKNTVVNVLGRSAYALITEAAVQHLKIPLGGSLLHSEHYEHYRPIRSYIFDL
jgi:Protein of unknown function (DUF2652)